MNSRFTLSDEEEQNEQINPIEENKYEDSDLYFYEQALNDAGVDTSSESEGNSDDEASEDDDLLKMLEGME